MVSRVQWWQGLNCGKGNIMVSVEWYLDGKTVGKWLRKFRGKLYIQEVVTDFS